MAPLQEENQRGTAEHASESIAIPNVSTPPTVIDVPRELLDIICKLATPRDVGALRATCKELQNKIESVFKEIVFDTIEIHLDHKHLQFLKQVSTSRFAACVKVVHIRPRYVLFKALTEDEVDAFATFREDKNDVNWLAEALCGFPNLVRLEVEATGSPASQTSLIEDAVRSSRSFSEPAPRHEDPRPRPHKGISYAFQVALLAMASMKKQGKSVPELRAGAMPDGILRRSVDHMSLKPEDSSGYEGLANLSALRLVLEVQEHTVGLSRELHLADLLRHSPNLKSLKLSFWHMAGDWLSSTFTSVNLPHLDTLQLEAAHSLDVLELEDFLKRHTSKLRHLELKNIIFKNDTAVDVLQSIFTSDKLMLHSIKLQQLCNSRTGLLLFGESVDLRVICHDCDQDRNATWKSEIGPGCEHGTLAADEEKSVEKELERVKTMCVLPWVPFE